MNGEMPPFLGPLGTEIFIGNELATIIRLPPSSISRSVFVFEFQILLAIYD